MVVLRLPEDKRETKCKRGRDVLLLRFMNKALHCLTVVTQTLDAFISTTTMFRNKFLLHFDWTRRGEFRSTLLCVLGFRYFMIYILLHLFMLCFAAVGSSEKIIYVVELFYQNLRRKKFS